MSFRESGPFRPFLQFRSESSFLTFPSLSSLFVILALTVFPVPQGVCPLFNGSSPPNRAQGPCLLNVMTRTVFNAGTVTGMSVTVCSATARVSGEEAVLGILRVAWPGSPRVEDRVYPGGVYPGIYQGSSTGHIPGGRSTTLRRGTSLPSGGGSTTLRRGTSLLS